MIKQGQQFKQRESLVSDVEHKLLDVARVARVTSGGRRFSFRAVVVVGDRSGKVGVASEKGSDVQKAVEKAVRTARKNMVSVPITKKGSIPHESYGKSSSAKVFLRPAEEGRGIIAGGAARVVCDLAGYRNIVGKILSRSVNKLNNARATVEALKAIGFKEKRGVSALNIKEEIGKNEEVAENVEIEESENLAKEAK